MRKWVVAIACLIAFYMDAVFFRLIGIATFAPEALVALFVSLGVLMGGANAALLGMAIGAVLDILLNKYFGPTPVFLLAAGFLGGIFHNKYYSDNLLLPAATAAGLVFIKEHIMLVIVLITGGRIANYMLLLLTHILPSALLTGALTAAVHLIMRKAAVDPARRKELDDR